MKTPSVISSNQPWQSQKRIEERFNSEFEKLLQEANPQFKLKAKIKLEPAGNKPGSASKPLVSSC